MTTDGSTASVPTGQDALIQARSEGLLHGQVRLDNATVVSADIDTSNGIVPALDHAIPSLQWPRTTGAPPGAFRRRRALSPSPSSPATAGAPARPDGGRPGAVGAPT